MVINDSPSVELSDDSVRLTGFELSDPEIVEYLRQVDTEDRATALTRALRVGVMTMGLAETYRQEEFVEHRFSQMQNEFETEIDRIKREVDETFGEGGDVPQAFETHLGEDGRLERYLEEAFGEDGPLTERLDAELGEDGDRIQQALDPDTEGTPTYRLKRTLEDQLNDLRDKIEAQATAEETAAGIRRQTTLKGDDFEETVDQILSDIVYNTSNQVEYTGDTIGELSDRKVGDFVLTLAETGQRIVIEAKSDSGYSQRNIKEELADAVENRDADYGVIVFESASCVPNRVGYFNEFDTERLSVALKETDEDDVEPAFLRIAYNWARTRAIQGYVDTGTALDPEAIQTAVSEVGDSINRFSTIRSKTTSIRKAAKDIDEELDEIEREITSELTAIHAELGANE